MPPERPKGEKRFADAGAEALETASGELEDAQVEVDKQAPEGLCGDRKHEHGLCLV